MEFGLSINNAGPRASPDSIRDVSQAAEDLGFHGLWAIDHLALPRHTSSPYVLGPQPTFFGDGDLKRANSPFYECLTALTYVAGLTRRIRLGTGVLVLPLRNPVHDARQLATLDVLSGGRLLVGAGAGWLREEAEALQMPWDHRGARLEEHIAVLRTLWEAKEPYVSYHGEFYRFEEIDPEPRPVQRPLPILIGGHSARARERAGRIGDGWMAATLPLDVQRQWAAEVREVASRHGRDPDKLLIVGYLRLSRGGGGALSHAELCQRIREHQEAGTRHLVVRFESPTTKARIEEMRQFTKDVLPEFAQPA